MNPQKLKANFSTRVNKNDEKATKLLVVCLNLAGFFVDKLNTSVHATMKTTPFELVFGQLSWSNIFPGVVGTVMEEDIAELVDKAIKQKSFLVQFLLLVSMATQVQCFHA